MRNSPSARDWFSKSTVLLAPKFRRRRFVVRCSLRGTGHCELFAGHCLDARASAFRRGWSQAFVRIVKRFSTLFTVRNADAHAWAELFDHASGAWLLADPLAVAAPTQAATTGGQAAGVKMRIDRSWKARLDSLRVFWYRRIVSFDQQSQVETLRAMKEVTQNSGKVLRETLANALSGLKAWLTAPWDLRRAMTLLGVIATGAALHWLWRVVARTWWRRLREGRGRGREDPVRREAGRWLGKLVAAGVPGEDTAGMIGELQRLRFGARATWSDPPRVFRRARRAWREARRGSKTTRS